MGKLTSLKTGEKRKVKKITHVKMIIQITNYSGGFSYLKMEGKDLIEAFENMQNKKGNNITSEIRFEIFSLFKSFMKYLRFTLKRNLPKIGFPINPQKN